MDDYKEEGRFFTTGGRLLELLHAFDDTPCERDCRVEAIEQDLSVDIKIHGCRDHAICFARMLRSERSIN